MSDLNYRNFYNDNTPALVEDLVLDPRTGEGWDGSDGRPRPAPEAVADVWKVDCSGKTFRRVSALCGGLNKEDGQDLNNRSCGNVFEGGVIEAGRGVAITCKGESCNNHWKGVTIRGRGRFCDYEQDNHSDQSKGHSSDNVLMDVKHEDGAPVRVAWGRGGPGGGPKIIGGNCRTVVWWCVVLHFYNFAKDLLPFIP